MLASPASAGMRRPSELTRGLQPRSVVPGSAEAARLSSSCKTCHPAGTSMNDGHSEYWPSSLRRTRNRLSSSSKGFVMGNPALCQELFRGTDAAVRAVIRFGFMFLRLGEVGLDPERERLAAPIRCAFTECGRGTRACQRCAIPSRRPGAPPSAAGSGQAQRGRPEPALIWPRASPAPAPLAGSRPGGKPVFWIAGAAVVIGVLLHVPDYVSARHMHFRATVR